MKIVLATSNKGKIEEFKKLMPNDDVCAFETLIGKIDIEETGTTFKENAVIKAKAVYDKIADEKVVVISDDSGISVPLFNNEPGVYSARYAGKDATDCANNEKLISKLNAHNVTTTKAFYTACIAMVYKNEVYTVHGWMYGRVIDKCIGSKGFGYDPMFIPDGFEQTLGELDSEVKKALSHRSRALKLAKKVLDVIL
ncbi:MAG: RdgB/HAM1 family non-canonical purine NTP pyrophosphatase [Candidatus Marinarcus sp.]|uniref:RdgB/HAM1 family non-canonical purine NTP pyrophosphatase n=1 Tax=Candidatus Marinarcus sp. TaxID=3100987 RepID=UPI003AFF9FB7